MRMVAHNVHVYDGSVVSRFGVAVLVVGVVDVHLATIGVAGCGRAMVVVVGFCLVEVLTKAADAGAGEDAEDVALVVVKLRRRFAAVAEKVFAQESLDASEGEMCELWAAVEKCVDTLKRSQ